jgi:hypothetical protein
MALKNYIFIFLLVYFGSIESNKGCFDVNATMLATHIVDRTLFKAKWIAEDFAHDKINPVTSQFIQPADGEVVINEIMADPSPVVGLPDREYLELYNARSTPVNMKGWSLGLGSKLKIFPDVTIASEGYLLVCGTNGSKDLQQFGNVVEISGFVLNNDGLTIALYDPDKRLTDQLDYVPSLHKKGFENGGFSLERIDPGRLCGQRYNWSTTLSASGGTPGSENAVKASNPDNIPPKILAATFSNDARLEVLLSESFSISGFPADFLKNIPAGVVIDSVRTDQNACLLQIYFRPSTILNGVNYSMLLHGLADECGNVLSDKVLKFGYYLPVKEDLLINEVLFNPYPEGSDFVEVYNNSGHEVDLSALFLATRDATKGLRQVSQISVNQQYIPIGSYLALTRSREGILRFYNAECGECILQMEKFPTLTDLSGCVVLLDKNQEVIDEMDYTDGMHHPFITETEGISLERISFSEPASRKENWHSAAKSAGYATPGYQNSVAEASDSTKDIVTVDPEIFSPNGDGINDQLNIGIHTGEPGWILNITILNCAGRVVRKLANNFMSGSSDHIVWDGLDGDFQKVQPGVYILNISLFAQSGKSQTMRFACVVTDRL